MTAESPVGSLGEEAVRLLDALQVWARRHADSSVDGSDGSDGGGKGDACPADHPAAECAFCPFCQLLAALRGSYPEVVEHLASAGANVAAAVRELLSAAASEDPPRRRANGLEHIDIG